MHKPDDGRPDFMSVPGGAGRMDGTPMKSVSGWETADEAARLKLSMMSREKMVSLFLGCVANFINLSADKLDRLLLTRQKHALSWCCECCYTLFLGRYLNIN